MIDFKRFRTKEEVISYIKASPSSNARTSAKAEKYLREHLPKEPYFQKKVLEAVKKARPDAFVWKVSAGPYSRAGIPDVCAVIDGRFYGFEVKRPFIGEISPLQKKTADLIRRAGGKVFFVSWPEDVYEAFKDESVEEGS